MEEIQKTMEQMSTCMNAVVIMVTVLLCLIIFSMFYLMLCTIIDSIKERCKQRAADKKTAESNTQNASDLSLTEKEKSQSEDSDNKENN